MAEITCVTLDGPAGVGKTTLARRLAQALSISYLDTGAMFRAAALAVGEPDPGDEQLASTLAGLDFSLQGHGQSSALLVNGQPLGDEIRTEEAAWLASNLAQRSVLREALKAAQRKIACETRLAAEGRDMGTVVFPAASHKFFLDAAPEERARRRLLQLQDMGKPADFEAIRQAIRQRDDQDRNRAVAPLKPADNAVLVDTTELDADGVFRVLMKHLG